MNPHIRNRGKDTWQIIYYAGGKHHAKTVHGTRKDAEAVRANIVAGLTSGDFISPSKQTLGAYLVQWLEQIRPKIRPSSYRSYETNCRVHIIPALGGIRLADLKPTHIQAFYAKLAKRKHKAGNGTKQLSPSTIASVHRTLRAALNRAVDLWLLPKGKNPIDGVDALRQAEREPHILTVEEAGKLLEASRRTGRYSLYLAALATGLRQGELLGLRWQDVDFERGIIYVRQQLTAGGNKTSFGEPKSKSGRRVVAAPQILLDALKEDKQQERPTFKHDLIWAALPSGNGISARNLDRQFKQLLAKAGLPDMRFHDLRHTHATWQVTMDLNLRALQMHLGHSSLDMVQKYTHQTPLVERKAAVNVDKLLRGRKGKANTPSSKPATKASSGNPLTIR